MLHYSTSTAVPKSHQRRSSRSNSASSSSIITIQRAASNSSRPVSRNTLVKRGSPSSVELNSRLGAVTPTASETALGGSPGKADCRASSACGVVDGVGSVNRWSQSTASSKSPPQPVSHHRNSFSRRASPTGSLNGSLSPLSNSKYTQSPPNGQSLTRSRYSRGTSPQRFIASDISTLPTVPQPLPASDPIKLSSSSWDRAPPVGSDYFVDPWRKRSLEGGLGRGQQSPVGESASGVSSLGLASKSQSVGAVSAQTVQTQDRGRKPIPSPLSSPGRDRSTERSGDTIGAGSASSPGKEKDRLRGQRVSSQKAMLSKALQKANTAVLLDNAANFEGAIEAYGDACQLLQLVMLRSNGGDDEKLKLQEIRNTYIARISELRRLGLSSQRSEGKALPERPLSDESFSGQIFHGFDEEDENAAVIETAVATRVGDNTFRAKESRELRTMAPSQIPPRRQSLLPSALDEDFRLIDSSLQSDRPHNRSRSDSYRQEGRSERSLSLAPLSEDGYVPLPLSPQGPYSPEASNPRGYSTHSSQPAPQSQYSMSNPHARNTSNESTSWLDTIDESGASSPSSTRSRLSSLYLRRRRSRRDSNGTEAEFDAALDAAVEAAYDEGLEPATDMSDGFVHDDIMSNARRNVELAKQRVREAEREAAAAMARGRDKRRIQEDLMLGPSDALDSDYVDEEAEEEERLLEEMTKGYVMDDFEFDLQSKSALPRQSGSSSFSGRTWGSSVASNTTTAGTSLSTLAEGVVLPSLDSKIQSKKLPPPPPPASSLPPVPSASPPALPLSSVPSASSSNFSPSSGPGVRARRLSGQNLKQLKIETNTRVPAGSQGPRTEPASMSLTGQPSQGPRDEPKTSVPIPTINASSIATTSRGTNGRTLYGRNGSIDSLAGDSPTTAALTKVLTQESEEWGRSGAPSPSRPVGKLPSAPGKLRKNVSSSSLKAMRVRNMSVSTPDISADSPSTPSSSTFPTLDIHKGMANGILPVLPTPTGAHFTPNGLPTGGLYLFDSNIHSPTSPGSPNPAATNAPIPLEPCPESFLLRPFWLMRCLYQTIAHPRGGYLSTKLFVPRDVWRVKNVKIKAVEEKVSNCDLLTAALLKLAQVDTYDADAVLEEMQSLENVLDQVQTSLAKKLGNEVGVQGSLSLFKSASSTDDSAAAAESLSSKASSGSGKSYLTSWRKLRSKNSGMNAVAPLSSSREGGKDNPTMSSLPMTSAPSVRVAKRNITQLQFTGPNANYMGALARLFDAVQLLDQIARQVEDPGLKHSSPTLVGLELSTRHAAEFFGFYVCRFALNDVGMMLDKFIKRGSEWVLI